MAVKYKRVILKISGEALKKDDDEAIFSNDLIIEIISRVKELLDLGIQVGIVVGAGNIWRGNRASELGMDGADADDMGMIATWINSLALRSVLQKHGIKAKAFSSVPVPKFLDYYTKRDALIALDEGYVNIYGGGTSNPFFTTDSAAALRALETRCDAILMAKNGVEGVYTADPRVDKNAKLIKTLTYQEILDKSLKVMDATAASLLLNSNIETRVFKMEPDNFIKVVKGEDIGTTLKSK